MYRVLDQDRWGVLDGFYGLDGNDGVLSVGFLEYNLHQGSSSSPRSCLAGVEPSVHLDPAHFYLFHLPLHQKLNRWTKARLPEGHRGVSPVRLQARFRPVRAHFVLSHPQKRTFLFTVGLLHCLRDGGFFYFTPFLFLSLLVVEVGVRFRHQASRVSGFHSRLDSRSHPGSTATR